MAIHPGEYVMEEIERADRELEYLRNKLFVTLIDLDACKELAKEELKRNPGRLGEKPTLAEKILGLLEK
jgi:hypothetical protein